MAKIGFYTDEHIAKAVTSGLRARGVDVMTVSDTGLFGAGDQHHLDHASGLGRVLVTQDADFLALAAAGAQHAGIVYARQGTTVGALIQGLMLIYQVLEAEDMASHVEFL